MKIRKTTGTLLAACLLAGSLMGALPSALAFASTSDGESQLVTLDEENASLFLPETYEQYLLLARPSYVAMSERYVAVADGQDIYVYDRNEEDAEYRRYRHQPSVESITVGKIQFSESDRLYFTSTAGLFELELGETITERAVSSMFTPYTFHIEGEDLFVVTTGDSVPVNLYRFAAFESHEGLLTLESASANARVQDTSSQQSAPLLTSDNGFVYCAVDDGVRSYDADTLTLSRNFYLKEYETVSPVSICAVEGSLFYTDRLGLHRSDMRGDAELVLGGEGFGTLTLRGRSLFYMQGTAVREFDLDSGTRTNYEISASSTSPERLAGAVESVRAGNLLVTADAAANRVTVYDLKAHSYSVIECKDYNGDRYIPNHVATDGSLIAVSSEGSVYLYRNGELSDRIPAEGTVTGLTCVYGTVYFVTQHNFGALGALPVTRENNKINTGLTSDLYGNLYVTYNDHSVEKFTEDKFLDKSVSGSLLPCKLPEGATSLRADFEGNLYCLAENTVYRLDEETTPFATLDAADFVYLSAGQTPTLQSFALGFEDDELYFLFGDFVVKSMDGALDLPTLDEIPVGNARDAFSEHGSEGLLIDVPAASVGIVTDLAALRSDDGKDMPYVGYYRTTEPLRGALLSHAGASNEYALAALWNAETRTYSAVLFRIDTAVDEAEYWQAGVGKYWISSDVTATFAPCMAPELEAARLNRGTPVTLLGTVRAPERDYALVEFSGTSRSRTRAFVPYSFLSDVDPAPADDAAFFWGWLKKTDGGVKFIDADGNDLVLTARTYMRFSDNGDGTFTAYYTAENGTTYTAQVTSKLVEHGESDAWRIALIVILSVLALVIIGAYIFLLPWEKKKRHSA